jgi:hypothetical protein
MAKKEGTGGRGGAGVLEALSLDMLTTVDEEERISRSRSEPSPLKPFIEAARKDLGAYKGFEDTVPVTDEDGNPIQETDSEGRPIFQAEDGSYTLDQTDTPVYATEQRPHPFTKAEALELYNELRNAGNREKLTAKRLSLRILLDPPKDKAPEEGPVFVQFYIIKMGPSGDGNAAE